MPASSKQNCPCGAPIVWAALEDGTSIPLDPKPAVYRNTGRSSGMGAPIVQRVRGSAVTHFATCPQANQFAKSVWRDGMSKIAAALTDEVTQAIVADACKMSDADRASRLAIFARKVDAVLASMPKPKAKKSEGKE